LSVKLGALYFKKYLPLIVAPGEIAAIGLVKTRQAKYIAAPRFRTAGEDWSCSSWSASGHPWISQGYTVDFQLNIARLEGGGEKAVVFLDSLSELVLATK
jgi:hypothetical protein